MKKKDFLERIAVEKPYLGAIEIETEYVTKAANVMGCYYDQQKCKWVIYRTMERGGYFIINEFSDEDYAYDVFYKLISKQSEAAQYFRKRNY